MMDPIAAGLQPNPVDTARAAREAFNRRYGGGGPGGRRGDSGPGDRSRRMEAQPPPPVAPLQPAPVPVRTGPVILLDERQLKVVMVVEIVKLIETKQAAPR